MVAICRAWLSSMALMPARASPILDAGEALILLSGPWVKPQ